MLYKQPPSYIHHNLFLDFKKPPNDNISTGKLNVRFLPSYFFACIAYRGQKKEAKPTTNTTTNFIKSVKRKNNLLPQESNLYYVAQSKA